MRWPCVVGHCVVGSMVALFASVTASAQQRVPPEYVAESQTRWPETHVVEPPAGYEERDYEDGDAVPDGYEVETSFHRGLVGGGAAVFGFSYALAIIAARVTEDPPDGEADPRSDESVRNRALYAPLIGPFIAAAEDRGGGERALVIANGLGQAAGLGLLVVGLTVRESKLVKGGDVALSPFASGPGVEVAVALP